MKIVTKVLFALTVLILLFIGVRALIPLVTKVVGLNRLNKTVEKVLLEEGEIGKKGLMKRALSRSGELFAETRWSRFSGEESDFARFLSLLSALYLELEEDYGQKRAYSMIRKIGGEAALQTQLTYGEQVMEREGMERIMAFNDLMDRKGVVRFQEREYITRSETECHYIIKRCIFNDFYTAAGTPELTTIFCESDAPLFAKIFPGFSFSRGSSWENTIVGGRAYCTFIFRKEDALKEEDELESKGDKRGGCRLCAGCGGCLDS